MKCFASVRFRMCFSQSSHNMRSGNKVQTVSICKSHLLQKSSWSAVVMGWNIEEQKKLSSHSRAMQSASDARKIPFKDISLGLARNLSLLYAACCSSAVLFAPAYAHFSLAPATGRRYQCQYTNSNSCRSNKHNMKAVNSPCLTAQVLNVRSKSTSLFYYNKRIA